MDTESDTLFTTVLVEGTDEAIAAWITTGPKSVKRLHQHLARERRAALPEGTSQRAYLDNLWQASHEVASAFPDAFLAAFEDPVWDENPFVCAGLGAIRRPEVTERLMRLVSNENHWLRLDAAVALRGHQHPKLRAVLESALQDPEYLVRYHVEERLEEITNRRGH